MQVNVPKLIQLLENSTNRKGFTETANGLKRKLEKQDEKLINLDESIPDSWKDKYGKTHFYHPMKQMILPQSREVWDDTLYILRKYGK